MGYQPPPHPDPNFRPRPLGTPLPALPLREQAEVAELLELGFDVVEVADIWRRAGLPLGPLEREIQRITGDSRPLPTPMPSSVVWR